MTLLLGPPSSGKSTLMRALAGKLDKNLKVVLPLYSVSLAYMYDRHAC
jgi:ABC-type multidrug transport system ATPase subunit